MTKQNEWVTIIDVTAENISETGIYCIKDKRTPGYNAKVEWFKSKINSGLRIKIAADTQNKQLGFIEFIPSELAWRPISAKNYLYIQCILLFVKKEKNRRIGSTLLKECEKEAVKNGFSGICTMSSEGPWMANKTLFEKNGFVIADRLDRFELMVKPINDKSPVPEFIDWTKQQVKYKGWNLIYSDQCPWHEKSITDLKQSAFENNIELKVKKLKTPKEAQNAPSGFGTFSLIKDGKLLGDHYLSRTRFENIVRQETQPK
jgi:GNAT superfamily N-acetyltransferase